MATTTTLTRLGIEPQPSAPEESGSRPDGEGFARPGAVVGLLTAIALIVRLVVPRGLDLEEATTADTARLSFHALIHALGHGTVPPLYPLLLWLVAHTVGSGAADLRSLSVLFGTLTVPMLYVTGRALRHERIGVLAAAFATIGPLAVWYSQEIGPYALVMLLATVTLWAQRRALDTDRARYWVMWATAAALLFLTQWSAVLCVIVEVLAFAWALDSRRCDRSGRRRARRNAALATIGVGLACEAVVSLLLTQLHNINSGGPGMAGVHPTAGTASVSPSGFVTNVIWALSGYHSPQVVSALAKEWPVALIVIALLFLRRNEDPSRRLLLAFVLLPMLLLLGAAARGDRGLFEVRFFIEAVPAISLLLAGLAWSDNPTGHIRRTFAVVVLIASGAALVTQQADSRSPVLFGYTAAFHEIASVAHPGDEIIYTPSSLAPAVDYFAPGLRRTALEAPTAASGQVFLVESSGVTGSNPAATSAQLRLLEQRRHLVAVFQAPDITVWQLSSPTSGSTSAP